MNKSTSDVIKDYMCLHPIYLLLVQDNLTCSNRVIPEQSQEQFIDITITVIKPKLALFQMQIESRFADTSEFAQPSLCYSPEVLDPVDVVAASGKLIIAVLDTVVLFETEVDKAVVGLEPIGIDNGVSVDFILYYRERNACRAVLDYLCIDLAAAFDKAENNVLAFGATAAFSANPASPEITFVDFHFAFVERTLLFRIFRDSRSHFAQDFVY